MAVDFASFLANIPSPVQRVQEGVLLGQQQGDRAQAQRTAREAAVQRKALNDELLALSENENKTPEDFLNLMTRFPQLADKFKAPLEALTDIQKQTALEEATSVFAALEGGQTDIAINILKRRKEAAEAAGDTQGATQADVMIQTIELNPDAAKSTTGLFLAQALGPEQFQKMFETLNKGKTPPKKTALQLKIDELMSTGLDRNTASNVATGRFRISRDPVTQVAQIIDVATGQIVGQKPTVGGDIVNEVTEQPTGDPTQATGVSGAAKAFSNVVADLFGADLPFEEADKAATELQNINLKTIQLASSGIAGRPNVFFQKKVDELLIKPNEIFTGAGQSRNRFESLSKSFKDEANRLQGDLDKGNVTPTTRDELQQRISALNSLSAEYDTLLQRSSPQDKGDITRFFK